MDPGYLNYASFCGRAQRWLSNFGLSRRVASSFPVGARVTAITDARFRSKLPRQKRRLAVGLVCGLAVIGAAFALAASHWPFTEEAVAEGLQERIAKTVEIKAFRRTYFPHPGCVAEDVTFRRDGDAKRPPLMEIQRLTIQSTFAGLLTHHVAKIRADGLRLRVPPLGSKPKIGSLGGLKISQIVINDAIVEFEPRRPREKPLRFNIYHSTFISLGGIGRTDFSARLRIPDPPGEVAVNGRLGPWRGDQPGQTPLTGSYTLERAMLGAFRGVAGTLSSEGKFGGVLERIEVQGATDMPDFQVTDTGHTMHLGTAFHVVVNGRNGDTFLEAVQAQLRRTYIGTRGSVAASSDRQDESGRKSQLGRHGPRSARGKAAALDMNGTGRIEDLLWLLTEAQPPRMTGALTFRTNVFVPPGPVQFLRKVKLQGDFEIASARFTNPDTQRGLEELSARVNGEKDTNDMEHVVADLKGHVTLQDGTATFSNLSVTIPGASAEFDGVYSFLSEKIDLRGTLHMKTAPSDATTGFKSVLLKFLGRFFKKKQDFVVPVRIGGTYAHPSFGFALGSKK
jgi:hypothetical protein